MTQRLSKTEHGQNPEDRFDICDQRHSILNGTGHMLVLGGPGSGKTTIALLKARRFVLDRLQPGQSVLFLSFSNAAVRRILESAGNILSAETEQRVEIKTYHSFAWRILRSHGYLLSSQRRLSIVAEQDAAVIRAGIEGENWVAEEERLFLQDGRVTYDQFAPRAAELLKRSAVIRACFSHAHPLILVDEFQDTDEDQWHLILALSENSEVIALGDTEQRIYTWRKGMSDTRLQKFAEAVNATTFDFQNENNRSPATGIMEYAHNLLSPKIRPDLPNDIAFKRFKPGKFVVGLRLALIRTWNESMKRAGHRDLSVAVTARSRKMVRRISDALAQNLTVDGKEYRPVPHDVIFNQIQITLAATVVALIMASQADSPNERLAAVLKKVSDVFRSSGKKTAIKTSDRLSKWANKCRDGKVPATKCVKALVTIFDTIDANGFSGSPTADWLTVRQALERSGAKQLEHVATHARYLRLLRRGSFIESRFAELWERQANYAGAEDALKKAISQNQLMDNSRETSSISVMTMHQLKGREYDAILLVEDQYLTFLGKGDESPFMETRRLLQVSLTRARHYVYILSAARNATLDVIFKS